MAWKSLPISKRQEAALGVEPRKTAKFLVDESVGPHVTKLLRDLGWSATDISDLGLQGQPDENVFAAAKRLDRILLTYDSDFLDDRRFPPRQNPGLVILPNTHRDRRKLLAVIARMLRIVGDRRGLWRSTKIQITSDGVWTVLTFEQESGRVVRTRYRFLRRKLEVWEGIGKA